jgi:erythronate-4-phosphate dehydrogenase
MKILCASSVLFGRECFEPVGEVRVLPDRAIGPETIGDADALVIRSKTPVGRALLRAAPGLSFVGTATAGFDHLDRAALEEAGVAWTAAPGCNAEGVAEWVTAALLECLSGEPETWRGRTIGIIGVGQVGSRVEAKARALGLRVLLNDPPREEREGPAAFTPLRELLAASDFATLHVPLETSGRWPTAALADESFFRALKPGAVFLNASRGEVVDENALRDALRAGRVGAALLDVFRGEPLCDRRLVELARAATPHIAGYSWDGKLRGTRMVFEALGRHVGGAFRWPAERIAPPPSPPPVAAESADGPRDLVRRAVRAVVGLREDDAAFRAGLAGPDAAWREHFEALRKNYRPRREFDALAIRGLGAGHPAGAVLAGLGFQAAAGPEGAA